MSEPETKAPLALEASINNTSCALGETFYGQTLTVAEFESIYQLQSEVLEELAQGRSLNEILDKLCLLAEKLVPNALASIMLLDEETRKLNVAAAPSIPEEGRSKLNNLQPGPHSGSCGNVIYQSKPVFVENTLEDDRWKDIKSLAYEFDLKACWSMPVSNKESIVGTFALTSFEHRMPNLFQHKVLETCAHIVGIALRYQKMDEELKYLAYHDPLTGLANRTKLELDVTRRIETAKGAPFSMILMGIDRFKSINDTHGHDVGDQVLKQIARRIESYVDGEFTVYRVGSDEFAILFSRPNCDYPMVESFCEALIHHIENPFQIQDSLFYLSASIGVACALNKQKFYDLMKEADTAMYAAKAGHGRQCRFFDAEMSEKVARDAMLERDLHYAIKNNEFVLYYQPLMDHTGQKVRSLEALIRWQHPQRGMIPPFEFIPLAEDIGIIDQITHWVVDQAIADIARWHEKGLSGFAVSVNVSGQEFNPMQIQSLVEKVEGSGLSPFFEFELTEGYLMKHAEESITLLEFIRSHGISIAMDDFGTGYSSLAYLKRFPVDKLKIDQSLVRDMVEDENDQVIVHAVIAMAHALKLKVVAEGVETQAHQEKLGHEGIDYLQGYLYAKPKPAVLVEKFIRQHL